MRRIRCSISSSPLPREPRRVKTIVFFATTTRTITTKHNYYVVILQTFLTQMAKDLSANSQWLTENFFLFHGQITTKFLFINNQQF